MNKKRGKDLLEQVKKAKAKQPVKNIDKLVGKQKSHAKFNKVNFSG